MVRGPNHPLILSYWKPDDLFFFMHIISKLWQYQKYWDHTVTPHYNEQSSVLTQNTHSLDALFVFEMLIVISNYDEAESDVESDSDELSAECSQVHIPTPENSTDELLGLYYFDDSANDWIMAYPECGDDVGGKGRWKAWVVLRWLAGASFAFQDFVNYSLHNLHFCHETLLSCVFNPSPCSQPKSGRYGGLTELWQNLTLPSVTQHLQSCPYLLITTLSFLGRYSSSLLERYWSV